jgi:Cu+-exporting ATPase
VTNEEVFHVSTVDLWRYIRMIESSSSHPLAKCLYQHSLAMDIPDSAQGSIDIQEVAGKGMRASFGDGRQVFIGTKTFLTANLCIGEYSNEEWKDTVSKWEDEAKTVIYVGEKVSADAKTGRLVGLVAVADTIRPEAKSVVKYLQGTGIDVFMLTGDNAATAKSVGESIGIPSQNILAQVLPGDKKGMIERLQSNVTLRNLNFIQKMYTNPIKKPIVAMVGYVNVISNYVSDGINDSPSLAQSDIGIALGSGSDIAIESAEAVLIKSDLRDVVTLLDLSRKTFSRVKWNLFYAFCYNCVGIPVAAGALFPVGIVLSPWLAGLAMAASSVSVVLSSLALKFYQAPVVEVDED